ncbi:competence protein ComEA [Providencia rustigianii]|uniref:ComEA family DNA-binding protein n=1 Tax=Providencia rustigianii TaxID=158850 RepID=UPI000F71FC65|nr:ComEA family DNA-binding protein [Providencia rustigianii]MTC60165.1 competence protein ComEA [Providencia rustigianii]VEH54136.1 competence protein ComEA helix-hairpin-helix repeat region [Providencia rustigianii]
MKWNKNIKQGLGTLFMAAMLYSTSGATFAKKIEPEKSVVAMTQPKEMIETKPTTGLVSPEQVNINQASAEELAKILSGIGKQKAQAIVEYREKYGAFNSIENILEVQGIGPAFLEKNRSKLVL